MGVGIRLYQCPYCNHAPFESKVALGGHVARGHNPKGFSFKKKVHRHGEVTPKMESGGLDQAIEQWTRILERATRCSMLEEENNRLRNQVVAMKNEMAVKDDAERRRVAQDQAYRLALQQGEIKPPAHKNSSGINA